jgi:hypothetical protein
MAIEDNDLIDRAIEAAEATIAEKEVIQESAPSPEPPQEAIETAEVKLLDKSNPSGRTKDEKGRFVSTKPVASTQSDTDEQTSSDQDANTETPEAGAEGEQPEAAAPIADPEFWSAEETAALAKAPADVRAIVARKEAQRNDWANRKASEGERGKAFAQRFDEVFKPYVNKLKVQGLKDPIEATERLLAWNEIFDSEPKTAIAALMRQKGLSPHDFFESGEGQGPGQEQYPADPRYDEARQIAEEAKQTATQLRAELEEQRSAALHQELEAFKDGKDSYGNVRRSFAQTYEPQIAQAVTHIKSEYPHLPKLEVLNHAYEYVLGEARKLHGVGNAPKPAAPPAKDPATVIAFAKKANAAAGGVSGAPTSGTNTPRPRAKSIDEAMDRAEERMNARA